MLFRSKHIEHIYDVFLSRVAEGRKMKAADVDSLGQGRVWIGADAKRIGLVDELGGINDAVALAAKLSGTEKYKIIELPEQKEPLKELIEDLTEDAQMSFIKTKMGEEQFKYYRQMESLMQFRGIQARMPFAIEVY